MVGGIALTDVCNLDCAHCWRKNRAAGHAPLEQVLSSLHTLYTMGARYLYIQGGEPFAWQDGSRRLGHVVDEAKRLGFFHVAVCTNGTFPWTPSPIRSPSASTDAPARTTRSAAARSSG